MKSAIIAALLFGSVTAEFAAETNARFGAVPGEAAVSLERIKVSKDQRGFVTASSERKFIPWGFNYDRDYKMRLIEDYWENEWPTVAEDFREMKRLGANVVRIHLSLGRFLAGPDTIRTQAVASLARLTKLAEKTGLYLDVTGLGCYRKSDVPAWYEALGESERWRTQARFWEAVAGACRASPAIFCYDLMNEPMIPMGRRKEREWLAGELGGFSYVQFISLDQAERARAEISRKWVREMVSAIRARDPDHLITLGMLPFADKDGASGSGFVTADAARELDFIAVHIYPRSGRLAEDLKLLNSFQVGKPLVVEELFPLACTVAELREFVEKSRNDAAGWIGFYWGQTPAELSASTDKGAILTRAWLELFQQLNPN